MNLEFYTIAQASRVLGCEPDELEHFIEIGKLPISFYAKKDKFIITDENAGLAVVTYTGLVKPKEEHVEELYAIGELFIEDEVTINAHGIADWTELPPVDADIYMQEADVPIDRWEATSQQFLESKKEYVAIFFNYLSAEHIQAKHKERRDLELKVNGRTSMRQYSYNGCRDCSVSDIRITHEDLMTFKATLPLIGKQAAPVASSSRDASTINSGKIRENELHELILKVLRIEPGISTRNLWRELRKDLDRKVRVYDQNEILRAVSQTTIEWESKYENVQYHKWMSFQGTVSRLRKVVNGVSAKS